jgi:proton glutamate symport protein
MGGRSIVGRQEVLSNRDGALSSQWARGEIGIAPRTLSQGLGGKCENVGLAFLNRFMDTRTTMRLPLHWQIVIALFLGVVAGFLLGEAAGYFEFMGLIFMRALLMIMAPLVFASLVVGVSGVGNVARLGKLTGKTLLYFFATTFVSVIIGLILVNAIHPGSEALKEELTQAYKSPDQEQKLAAAEERATTFYDFFLGLIRQCLRNPFEALANLNVLGIILFAILFGGVLTTMGERGKPVLSFFEGVNEAMHKLTALVMKVAPFGVFALMARAVAAGGLTVLRSLLMYSVTVLVGLAIHATLILPTLLRIFGKVPVGRYANGMKTALLTAFSSASSSATLPITMKSAEDMGVSRKTAGFVLPIGATINMDGTALYEAVAAIFIAQVYGVPMSFGQQVIIFLTATLAAVGAAGIPSAGTVTMVMVLKAVGLPWEGVGLILAVDRLLDMCRTAVNVWGDAVGAAIIARTEGERLLATAEG